MLTTENGDSITHCKPIAHLAQAVTPAKHPPSGLKFVREVKIDSFCRIVCDYEGYIYIGQTSGKIDKINHHGQVMGGFITFGQSVQSLEAHGDSLYSLAYGKP